VELINTIDPKDLYVLAANDSDFFCRTFFPSTFRNTSPRFQRELWDVLEDRRHRHVGFEVFRGGAKTTTLRAFTAKRIAFGTSRTVMFVSASQEHSIVSLNWLRNQIERNHTFSRTFGLTPGNKWTETHFEVENAVAGVRTNVIAVGITGQTRGFNIDDFRPDLIVVDDPCDEDNTATPEQRKKIENLFFGALEKSLTPATENPDAKIVLLQTSLDNDDLINQCHRDPHFATRRFPCFDADGNSMWEERFPTEQLLKDKESHIARNQLHMWLKEMECSVSSPEMLDFRPDWLQYWNVLPEEPMATYLAIDPVPPPSSNQSKKSLVKKDFECLAVVGATGSKIYLLEYAANRGHTPAWTVANYFRLAEKWRILKTRVETVAYQATLKWILEQEMLKRGQFYQINSVDDKRRKRHRIVQSISGVASAKRLYVHASHTDFVQQFSSYPNVEHEDVLEAVSMAVAEAEQWVINGNLVTENIPSLSPLTSQWRHAP